MIIVGDPDIVVAGDDGFATGKVAKKLQALREMLIRADVAAEQKQIRRLALQLLMKQARCVIAEAIVAVMQVGGDGDAHDDLSIEEWERKSIAIIGAAKCTKLTSSCS